MMGNIKVTYYKNLLLSITQKITNGKANIAKPVLLLTIIDLVEEGYTLGNKIHFDEKLIKRYREFFKMYDDVITNPEYPFYYLRNDGFFFIKGDTERRTPSAKYIREHIEYAYLDVGLWELLQDSNIRKEFKQILINHYLKQ